VNIPPSDLVSQPSSQEKDLRADTVLPLTVTLAAEVDFPEKMLLAVYFLHQHLALHRLSLPHHVLLFLPELAAFEAVLALAQVQHRWLPVVD
jgi:hypothetical protein